jgi:hypothetical protein
MQTTLHPHMTTHQPPLIQKFQAARKAAFLKSDRTPWSREEWVWHNERQQELAQQRANFSGSDLEFLAQI